jgi:glutamate dehydrogenase (NADP+)
MRNEFTGILTGKDSLGFINKTGSYRVRNVYFAQSMLETKGSFAGKTIVVSGSGNVAQYSTEKATQLGGKVVTMSDSAGYIYDAEGIDAEKLAFVMELKMN